ncbi:calmodulin-like protein [Canna indica]|uniref:Calmodulin-like protein n=1 Tax=Canna indica TaxID=4628 RepID=A0AAQ3KWR2_9LILI|nr:calmodulin-like protein [Canna indica]
MCPSGRHHRGDNPSPGLRPAFDVLDADRDGKISRDDLKAFFSSSSSGLAAPPLSDDDIGQMISAADADSNGLVEFEEFERVLARRGGAGGGDVMAEAFRFMDRDGDGKVGFGDLKAYLEMAGLPAGDEDVWAMLRLGGGGRDAADGVSFDGLLRILAVDFANGA